MPKQILILSSSPRKGGNSDTLCDQFALGAREAGHSVEKVRIPEHRIHYCTGCGVCVGGKSACPQQDDMAGLLDRVIAADVLVLATPVYFYTMAAQMKTFIDRCCARYTEITGKDFYFIATAADGCEPALERTIEGFRGFLSCLTGSREKGIVYGAGAWGRGEIDGSPAMQVARQFGRQA